VYSQFAAGENGLINVCFGSVCGPKSDIATCPKSAEADQEVRTKESGAREWRDSSLPALARFGLSSRNPTAVRPAPAGSGEDFVSAIGSIIDETRAVPLSAASSLGLFTLLLTSP
jgi:hypothetical protein